MSHDVIAIANEKPCGCRDYHVHDPAGLLMAAGR
jgi:hypothetical protein